MPTASELLFEPVPAKGEIFRKAMIVLLGAYSTGKSSFINALLDSDDRAEGTAPQDDKVIIFPPRAILTSLLTDDSVLFVIDWFPRLITLPMACAHMVITRPALYSILPRAPFCPTRR